MDDLVKWLRAQLDEDERIARAAAAEFGAAWTVDGETVVSDFEYVSVVDEPGSPGVHIAEWDPARVLRDVDAKRRIIYLAEHLPRLTATTELFDNNRDAWNEVIKQLALPYADRLDYQDSWRP